MGTVLSRSSLTKRELLERLGEARIKDAEALLERGRHVAAIYLAGYAVECYLKAAIYATLDWEELYSTFAVHDLDGLLLYSGLSKKIDAHPQVRDTFRRIVGEWQMGRSESVRYRDPNKHSEADGRAFLDWVLNPRDGVLPWVKGQI